jgi:hypothetical protein
VNIESVKASTAQDIQGIQSKVQLVIQEGVDGFDLRLWSQGARATCPSTSGNPCQSHEFGVSALEARVRLDATICSLLRRCEIETGLVKRPALD